MASSSSFSAALPSLQAYLSSYGVSLTDSELSQGLATLSVSLLTLLVYYLCFGMNHRSRRKQLETALEEAEELVLELKTQIAESEAEAEYFKQNKPAGKDSEEVRVFMDGAFDMMHYGHMNAFRQGRALGTYLVVGVNDDASITKCKGTAPVLNDEERVAMVKACKWVDEVVLGVPYVMTPEYLDKIIKDYKIDYVVHGDDPCIVNGKDVYATAKRLGMYRSIPRTEGVSTTDIVGRMLYTTRDHHKKSLSNETDATLPQGKQNEESADQLVSHRKSSFVRSSKFLTTSRMIRIFSSGVSEPPKVARIVYIDGAFDMFHPGHIRVLEQARKLGDYLIVGLHNDQVVNQVRGSNFPILNLNERVLSVLGCKLVDDVLLDAPYVITRDLIASLKISVVVAGPPPDFDYEADGTTARHAVAKDLDVFRAVDCETGLTVDCIIDRIFSNEAVFQRKVTKKMAAEKEYYSNRYGFDVSAQQ